ncbi:MAG: divalent cation tolerance protein CutA [Bacteroidia bacterium]|nr:divalent cation tolerance protein CutA [Bacteroidia bacterium]
MITTSFRLIYCTVPNVETANQIGKIVVSEKLAACCNVIPQIESCYWWDGKLTEDKECVLILKTHEYLFSRIVTRISELHPYQCPCILEIPITDGNVEYLQWLESQLEFPNFIEEAKNLATGLHKDQKYGEFPYIVHLELVDKLVNQFLYLLPSQYHLVAQTAAWLHDVLEDTGYTEIELQKRFPKSVCHVVKLLSKQANQSYDEYYANIASHPAAVFVKLCDRLANVRSSLIPRNDAKLNRYKLHQQNVQAFLNISPFTKIVAEIESLLN